MDIIPSIERTLVTVTNDFTLYIEQLDIVVCLNYNRRILFATARKKKKKTGKCLTTKQGGKIP